MAVTSTDKKRKKIGNGSDYKHDEIRKSSHKKKTLKMVFASTSDKEMIINDNNKLEAIVKACQQKDQLKKVNADSKEDEIGNSCDKQDQMEMAVTPIIDKKEETSNGKSCQHQDQMKMTVTPTTSQKEEIANGDNKEEKIGKTCHQCRQKIKGLSVCCTNKKKDKTCPNKFCHKCLGNRYGEKAEEKSALKDWNCPKCRGICNCSVCMKRRGHQPTGILVHTAKATGFASVSELLRVQGPKALTVTSSPKVAEGAPENNDTMNIETSDGLPSTSEKENYVSTDSHLNGDHVPSSPIEKNKKRKRAELSETEEISLPQGTKLANVAGIQFQQEDVGHALQFLEFCNAFKEVFDLKEREPEYILLELIRGGNGCRGKQSPVIRFHIILLSMIHKDFENEPPVLSYKSGKTSWLNALQNFASKSRDFPEKMKLEDVSFEADEYEKLGSSLRLRILNFLCDEVLCTVKVRSWIEDQNLKFAENMKASKDSVQAAKQKANKLKQKMQDEVAQAIIANNGALLSASEHEAIVSNIEIEISEALAKVAEAKKMVPNEGESCDIARTEPLISDINGRIYWKLKGYSDDSNLFLQDVGKWDGAVCSEKWLTLDAEQGQEVEECVRSLRKRKVTTQRLIFT